jgi:hypothetical protein
LRVRIAYNSNSSCSDLILINAASAASSLPTGVAQRPCQIGDHGVLQAGLFRRELLPRFRGPGQVLGPGIAQIRERDHGQRVTRAMPAGTGQGIDIGCGGSALRLDPEWSPRLAREEREPSNIRIGRSLTPAVSVSPSRKGAVTAAVPIRHAAHEPAAAHTRPRQRPSARATYPSDSPSYATIANL